MKEFVDEDSPQLSIVVEQFGIENDAPAPNERGGVNLSPSASYDLAIPHLKTALYSDSDGCTLQHHFPHGPKAAPVTRR